MNLKTNNQQEVSSLGTHQKDVLIIVAALITTLLFIWLVPNLISLFSGHTAETGMDSYTQSVVPDSSDSKQDSLSSIPVITDSPAPDYWLQGRGTPTGNAGWSDKIAFTSFDTLWIFDDVGGREFFSAPAYSGGKIYFGCNDGYMRCLNVSTGDVIWSFKTPCGICGEPAVDSLLVYFGGQDGTVYALDRNTGAEVWHRKLGYHIFCNVAIYSDTLLLTGNSDGTVYALDIRTGNLVWQYQLSGIVLGPVISDSLLIFTTEDGMVAAFNSSGAINWQHSYQSQASPPSVSGTSVIVGFSNGIIRNFSLLTGEVIFETDITTLPLRCLISRPVIVGSRIYAGTCDSRLVCIDISSGELIWEQIFENWIQLPPVLGKSSIYLSCDDQRLHILDSASGEKLDSLEMGGYSGTAPLLMDNTLYYGTTFGEFFALEGIEPISVPEDSTDTLEIREP